MFPLTNLARKGLIQIYVWYITSVDIQIFTEMTQQALE